MSALSRPARMRGPCSAHAIPRAGQLVGLRGARLERVVPGRPSRVARGEGDEADTTGSQSRARPRAGRMCQFMQRFLNQSIFFALVASLSLTEVACGDGEKEPISGYDWGFVGVSLVCELYVLISLCRWVN